MRLLVPAALALFAADAVAQIPMPKYTRTFSAGAVRGYYFKAPGAFIVTAVRVPDETNQGKQTVAIYRMTAAPPPFSQNRTETPVFFAADVPANQIIALKTPVIFKKDEWVGVLGSCGVASTARQANSYGTANYPGRVNGMKVTLQRMLTQTAMGSNMGVTPVSSENAGPIARVLMWTASQGSTAHYGASQGATLERCETNPPSVGFQVGLTLKSSAAGNRGGVWILGVGRTAVKTSFGTLLTLPLISFPVSGPIPPAGATIKFPIPNTVQRGAKVNLQAAVVPTNGPLLLSNGAELRIGQ